MNQIELKHKGGISKILVNQSCHYLTEILDEKDFVVITDTNLIKLYQDFLWRFKTITIPAGEQFKKLSEIEQIYQKLIDFDVNREQYIVGFGGGVICDIAGFIASTFMRGMKLINIPTTLLAQTDSAIGGKNGVNFLQFKNVIGTYHQPDYVICDINLLKTLPEREIRSSLAESIKAGLVYSEEFFEYFEKLSSSNLYANNFNLIANIFQNDILENIISSAIKIKVDVVQEDEFDYNKRRILNFGHTIGHSIESIYGMRHGESISLGMVNSAKISQLLGFIEENDVLRIKNLLSKFGLPVDFIFDIDLVMKYIARDKKRSSDNINFIALEKIGKAKIVELNLNDLKNLLYDLH